MKPFDLEAAKRGDPICLTDGQLVDFIGVDSKGYIVVESDLNSCDRIDTFYSGELYMAPKKRTVWVNLYPQNIPNLYMFDTEERADQYASFHRLLRIGDKAYPVEIEE